MVTPISLSYKIFINIVVINIIRPLGIVYGMSACSSIWVMDERVPIWVMDEKLFSVSSFTFSRVPTVDEEFF